ncbi:MAG: response regulator transcription factor [Alphaproteobacteria bacterium]|nr:response regulator transcription factor [Alphaproteobacteria bacterium]MCB9698964.1 response regulator transcription factor [Alphaproteobacteria bacterium]
MFPPLPVLLVADDPLVRSGLAALLPDELPVVRAVGTGIDVDAAATDAGAEVVLWDAPDPSPEGSTELPVVVLVRDQAAAARARELGAHGVLLRDVSPDRLAAAVFAVRHGLRVVDDRLDEPSSSRAPQLEQPSEALTARELEVLSLLAEGRSNREIGIALDISPHTAKFHVDRLLAKLFASSRTDAVVRAVRMGLLVL